MRDRLRHAQGSKNLAVFLFIEWQRSRFLGLARIIHENRSSIRCSASEWRVVGFLPHRDQRRNKYSSGLEVILRPR
jgi:hypothetical protein